MAFSLNDGHQVKFMISYCQVSHISVDLVPSLPDIGLTFLIGVTRPKEVNVASNLHGSLEGFPESIDALKRNVGIFVLVFINGASRTKRLKLGRVLVEVPAAAGRALISGSKLSGDGILTLVHQRSQGWQFPE